MVAVVQADFGTCNQQVTDLRDWLNESSSSSDSSIDKIRLVSSDATFQASAPWLDLATVFHSRTFFFASSYAMRLSQSGKSLGGNESMASRYELRRTYGANLLRGGNR